MRIRNEPSTQCSPGLHLRDQGAIGIDVLGATVDRRAFVRADCCWTCCVTASPCAARVIGRTDRRSIDRGMLQTNEAEGMLTYAVRRKRTRAGDSCLDLPVEEADRFVRVVLMSFRHRS